MNFDRAQWLFPIAVLLHNGEEAIWMPGMGRAPCGMAARESAAERGKNPGRVVGVVGRSFCADLVECAARSAERVGVFDVRLHRRHAG